MNNNNPDLKPTIINIVILSVLIIIVVGTGYAIYHFTRKKNESSLGECYEYEYASDTIKHDPVKNNLLNCPPNPLNYSFTFFLEINDFYYNRGYWKCIMLKGTEVLESHRATRCVESIANKEAVNLSSCNIEDNCDTDQCDKLKATLNSNVILNPEDASDGLGNRLDVICRALNIGDEGKEMVCNRAANCGLFINDKGNFPMRKGTCRTFLEKHKTYCDKVYALDKRVERRDDRERNEMIMAEAQRELAKSGGREEADILEVRNNPNIDNEMRFAEYDNICNQQNYLRDYPDLLPSEIEELKETDLINRTKKSSLNDASAENEPYNLEGCYSLDDIENDEKTDPVLNSELDGKTDTEILNLCNTKAEELGYEYFGIRTTVDVATVAKYKCYFCNKEDLETKTKNFVKEQCKRINNTVSEDNIYVTKVKKPGETIVKDCWQDIVENYPYQNPGVWIHPFTNNIRIILTTNSNEPHHSFITHFDLPTTNNKQNYSLRQIEDTSPAPEVSKCDLGGFNTQKNYYREYFDILNVPINNEFHLGLIIAGKSATVYINGELNQTQNLFGDPTFNAGPLQINPGQKDYKEIKLGGVVRDFKFCPKVLSTVDIQNQINNRKSKQEVRLLNQ